MTVQLTNGHQLGLVRGLSVVFGFEGKDTKVLKTTESSYASDLAAISTIYVCCNIVQPQIVGDANTQFLKSIPVKGMFGDTIGKPFANIQYVHVQRKSFEDVEIFLKSDRYRRIVPCERGKVVITLHLRQRSYFTLRWLIHVCVIILTSKVLSKIV